MRDIKFRFFTPDNRMIDDHEGWIENIGINEALECSAEYGYKIMQFTGLQDKNGKDIYEGDIIDIHQTVNGQSLFYIESILPFKRIKYISGRLYEYDENELLDAYKSDDEKEIEVIGNIYENPDLLRTP